MPCACLESPARASATAIAGRFVRLRERARLVAARPRACPKLPTSASSKAAKAATPAALSLKLFSLVICNACSESPRAFFSSPKWAALPGAAKPKILIPASLPEAHCSSRCMPASSQSRSHRMKIEVNIGVIGIAAQPHGENRPGFIGPVLCHIRNCNHIKDGELMRANPDRLVGFLHAFLELPKKNGVVNGQIVERCRVARISLSPHLFCFYFLVGFAGHHPVICASDRQLFPLADQQFVALAVGLESFQRRCSRLLHGLVKLLDRGKRLT